MKRKILTILVMMLIASVSFTIIVSTESKENPEINDLIEISVYAGLLKTDYGFGISIDLLSHHSENLTVFYNQTFDFIFQKHLNFERSSNITLPPERPWRIRISQPQGIKNLTLIVECHENTVYREGISINKFIIFNT